MNKKIEPAYVTFAQAKWLKEIGFNIPVSHCFVHDKGERYYLELFSFFVGTFCSVLTEVYHNEKEIRNFNLTKNPIYNESEIYFDYNQDIRKLCARLYNGEEYMNDEKSFNMNINSYDWEKLSAEEEEKLKVTLPNYNDGNFNFTVYKNIISAPEQWQVIEYLEQKGIIIELIVDGWGDNNCVSKENLCYRVFIWQIGKPKPHHNDDLGAFATKQEAYSAAFDYIKNEKLIRNENI